MESRSAVKVLFVIALMLGARTGYAQTQVSKFPVPDQPVVISAVAPYYPLRNREMHVSGGVKVFVTLNDKGAVTEAKGISGTPSLRPICEQAAKQWRFAAAAKAGEIRTASVSFVFYPVEDDRHATDEDRQHDLVTFKPPYEVEIGFWTPVITLHGN